MTAPRTLSLPVTTVPVHDHAWITESTHATSEGRVRYVRCTGCLARRVDIDAGFAVPPSPLSRTLE